MPDKYTSFSLPDLRPMPAIDGWQDFMSEGHEFQKTAVNGHAHRQQVFTPEILYNLIAMAIEKYVMAALMRHGALPYNHTMRDLVESIDETFPGEIDSIREGLLKFDEYQDICDLDGFKIIPPDIEEIPVMLALSEEMKTFAMRKTAA